MNTDLMNNIIDNQQNWREIYLKQRIQAQREYQSKYNARKKELRLAKEAKEKEAACHPLI